MKNMRCSALRLPPLPLSALVCGLGILCGCAAVPAAKSAPDASLTVFEPAQSPLRIGKLVADHFASKRPEQHLAGTKYKTLIYPIMCTWYGAFEFARVTGDKPLEAKLLSYAEPLVTTRRDLLPKPVIVDYSMEGSIPLEAYLINGDKRHLALGLSFADAQWVDPAAGEKKFNTPERRDWFAQGYTPQTRLWIDDMFMITIIQVQAYRATGDRKYIDRLAREMCMYLDRLQQPSGLFYHAPDVPFVWGRGDGWFAVGMAETLLSLPADSEYRPRILAGYRKMMDALVAAQRPDGMWAQLIGDPAAWPETSGTGMFVYSLVTGVREGWLTGGKYAAAARRGWLALASYVNPDGNVREVCAGTNKKNDHQYYLDRPRIVGDQHGQAPVLWAAAALLRCKDK